MSPDCGAFAADLAAAGSVFEDLARPGSLLDGRNVFPGLVVAGTVPTMQRVEDAKPSFRAEFRPATYEEHNHLLLPQPNAIPYLASF